MKFGSVEDLKSINFALPADHPHTQLVLQNNISRKDSKVFVGLGSWNKQELKGFYPREVKDELEYYSSQFNCIELNATFYQPYLWEQFQRWKLKTPEGFKFFPKINQTISHVKRLNEVKDQTQQWIKEAKGLEEKLQSVVLQLHDSFGPKNFDRVVKFIRDFPSDVDLAVDIRSNDWFENSSRLAALYTIFEEKNISNILFDTAGRRDILTMRPTNPKAYIRFTGYGQEFDELRLEDWVKRIKIWKEQGLDEVYFLAGNGNSQNPVTIARSFIEKINNELSLNLSVPRIIEPSLK